MVCYCDSHSVFLCGNDGCSSYLRGFHLIPVELAGIREWQFSRGKEKEMTENVVCPICGNSGNTPDFLNNHECATPVLDTTIQVKARHLTSDETIREIRECYGVREFSDSAALTVASWFAASGAVGDVLAALSTGAPVDLESLLTDIHMTRIHTSGLMAHDREGLDLLATWAIRKVNDRNA